MSLFDWMYIDGSIGTLEGEERLSVWFLPSLIEIEKMFEHYFQNELSLIERLQMADEIWIKPNITGNELPKEGKTTQPIVLSALLKVLKRFVGNTRKTYVADSSVIGCDTKKAAFVTGIQNVCDNQGVKFIDLREVSYKNIVVPIPFLFEELQVNSPFVSKEVFKINIAKIKTTYGSPVGFCVKNNKGVITDELKLNFHLKGLQKALCDLGQVLNWDVSILEGLPMSELGRAAGNGPFGISTNAIVLDSFFCICLKVPLSVVAHLQVLSEMNGITEESFEKLHNYREFKNCMRGLKYTNEGIKELARRYSVKIDDGDACSACVESFAKALSRLSKENNLPTKDMFFVGAQGCTEIDKEKGDSRTIFVGNCAFDRVGMELHQQEYPSRVIMLWRESVKIEGCPPTIDKMVEIISSGIPEKEKTSNRIVKSRRVESAFDINPLQIFLDAEVYQRILKVIPKGRVSFHSFGLEKVLACEVICAAICHQINWDFLRKSVYDAIFNGAKWWRPENIGKVDANTIKSLLLDSPKKERIRAEERSEMLCSLSSLFNNNLKSFSDLFGVNEIGKQYSRTNIVENLRKAPVFSEDPGNKKLQVILHSLAHSKIIYGVEELCEPAIDYHIMRLYLRRGDIFPVSKVGREFLYDKKSRQASTVTAFRSVVSEALRYACSVSRLPVHIVNTVEWWVGRSVCLRDVPDCELNGNSSAWLHPITQKCPFSRTCFGYNCNRTLLSIGEPIYAGRLY